MKRVFCSLIYLSLAFFLCSSFALAYTSPGTPVGRVNDFANVLTTEQVQELELAVRNFEQATGNQLAVVTVQNLGGDTIENYANELFREWGIGDKEKNNGLLFLIALEDRKMRIEVGYGLEGSVTDIATKHIQDDLVRPAFQAGNYWLGIAGGTNELIKLAGGEAEAVNGVSERLGSSSVSENFSSFLSENLAIFGLFAIYAVLSILMKVKKWGKEKQKPIFGITGTVFSLGLWLLGLISLSTLFYLAFLVLAFTLGGRGRGFGGGFGSGGFSGGGGGGFGGGSSGGGGSSSSW